MSGQWLTAQTGPDTVHALSLDDGIVHDHAVTCPCGPTEQREENGSVWVHHSLDGREFTEPGGPA